MNGQRRPVLPVIYANSALDKYDNKTVKVLHVFPTSQNWQTKLAED